MRHLSRALVPARRLLSVHLDHLRRTLEALGQQLREALARAVAPTVEGAVREAVHTALDDPPPDQRLTGRSAWLTQRNPDLWEQSDDPALDDLDDRWPEEEDDPRRPAPGASPAEPRSARCARALAVGCQAAAWWFCRQAGRCSTVAALGVGLAATGAAYAAGNGLAVSSLGLLTLASAVGAGAAVLAWFGTA
jgi:hypothetical protein